MSESGSPPPRWKDAADTSPALQRALRALGKQDVRSARLARVAERLGDVLDAPPPAVPRGGPLPRTARFKLLAVRLAVGALAVGATAIWLTRAPSSQVAPAPMQQTREQQTSPLLVSPPHAGPAAVDTTLLSDHALVQEPVPRFNVVTTPPPPLQSSRRARRPKTEEHVRDVPVGHARPQTRTAASTQAEEPLDTVQPVAPQAVAPVVKPAETPRSQPPQSEIELLFSARQLLRSDPRAALEVLAEHQARFVDGSLVPEREVLAIEALRKLGRASEAERRLLDFQTRYPESWHQRRLNRTER